MFKVERIGDDTDYLTRVHLTPWKWWPLRDRLYLHIFHRPDDDRHLHDHPFGFRSIVLWGGYDELVAQPEQPMACEDRSTGLVWVQAQTYTRRRGWLSNQRVPATYRHTISRLHSVPTVTLVIRGEKERDWGFWVPGVDGERWIIWYEYLGVPYAPPAYAKAA